MPNLKIWNSDTSEWQYISRGGAKGDTGVQGDTGVSGSSPLYNHSQFVWVLEGANISASGISPIKVRAPYVGDGGTIEEVFLQLGTAPSASPIRIDILENGSTIFSGTEYVEVGTTSTSAVRTSDFSGSIVKDHYYQLEIVQGDATASDLTVHLRYSWNIGNTGLLQGEKGDTGMGGGFQQLNASASLINWNLSNGSAEVTLTQDSKMINTTTGSANAGRIYFLAVNQPSAGSSTYDLDYDENYYFSYGGKPVTTKLVGAKDVASFVTDGSHIYNTGFARALMNEFNPDSIADLDLWLRADTLSLDEDDPVGTWEDESGNNNDFTQTESGSSPIFKTNMVNGKPAIFMDNINDNMTSSYYIGNSGFTIFLVAKAYDTTAGYHRILTHGGWWDIGNISGDQWYIYSDAEHAASSAYEPTNWSILRWETSAGDGPESTQASVNDTVWYTGSDGYPPTETIKLGRPDNPYADCPNSYVAEVIIYGRRLLENEIDTVQGYLSAKYGISLA